MNITFKLYRTRFAYIVNKSYIKGVFLCLLLTILKRCQRWLADIYDLHRTLFKMYVSSRCYYIWEIVYFYLKFYYYFAYYALQVLKNQRRYLNLLEYQSKALLQDSGVAIQEFCVLDGVHGDNTKCLQNFSNYFFFSFFRLIFVNKNVNTVEAQKS